MDYSTLGSSGLTVSNIALDARSIGGATRWRADIGRARALDFLRRTAATGCNLVIVSPSQHDGEGERRVGAAIRDRRAQWVVCSCTQPEARGSVSIQLEGSLRRLATEHIDLYLVTDHQRFDDRTAAELEGARQQGKIRAWGLAEPGEDSMEEWCQAGATAIVLSQSLRHHPAAQLLTAQARGAGVVGCCTPSIHPRAPRRNPSIYKEFLAPHESLNSFTLRYLRSLQAAHAVAVDAVDDDQLQLALASLSQRVLDGDTLRKLDRIRETHGIGDRLKAGLRQLAAQVVRVDG